jgi:ATP-dependent helicase Lhr and Lhr-like helicase
LKNPLIYFSNKRASFYFSLYFVHCTAMKSIQTTYNAWFKQRGWKSFQFQQQLLDYYLDGYSGLLNAPTGSGKTFALWLPVLMEYLKEKQANPKYKVKGLQVLWITPVRALANDIKRAMESACEDLGINWKIAVRTGDTSTTERAKQKKNIPNCLITTPESLHLMLASKNYPELFINLRCLVADEWHELLGTKRGVQIELAFSRIKVINPGVKIWGISATIGNLEQALDVLLGEDKGLVKNTIVRSEIEKRIEVETLMPDEIEKFPWGGHLGISLLPKVLETIHKGRSVLVFTNTRSQTEIWYQRLLEADPSLAGIMAIHHGSVSDKIRVWVENALHEEKLKAVICTSSLDLGVDFRPVETVIQIGGPKGVARFIQRAGRSGHQPGATSKIYFVPTNSLELIEAAALRTAVEETRVEDRMPVVRAFDVLVQYLVTLAVSDGFDPSLIKQEIQGTFAYKHISDDEWNQVISFITTGGVSLKYYDEFHKVVVGEDGLYRVTSRRIAMYHRLSIGTIVSDPMMSVVLGKSKRLGSIEETFISRLNPGDVFSFAGRMLEVVRIRDMVVQVKLASSKKPIVPQWLGGKMSLSSQLSEVIRHKLTEAGEGRAKEPEIKKLMPLLEIQKQRSIIPNHNQLLIEKYNDKDGHHLFVYPFEGRYINEGIAALIGFRIAKIQRLTYSISINDYGFELISEQEIPLEEALKQDLFSSKNLMEDVEAGLNSSEMARRKFRDIAHIAGLLFKGYPGKEKRVRHLQASSRLFFEVFAEHEPDNVLLRQAHDEVRFELLDEVRMRRAFNRINEQEIVVKELEKPTPLAFPLMVEMFRAKLTTEKLEERVKRLLKKVE